MGRLRPRGKLQPGACHCERTARGIGAVRPGVLAVVVLVVAFTSAPRCPAAVEGDLDLLRKVAEQNRANLARLKTWRGTAEIVEERDGTDGVKRKQPRTVKFVADRSRESVRWHTTIRGGVGVRVPGREPMFPDEVCMAGMVTPDAFYDVEPTDLLAPGGRLHLSIFPSAEGGPRARGYNFDPVHLMNLAEPSVARRMTFFADRAAEVKGDYVVSREGDRVNFELGPGDPVVKVSRYVFDLDQGGLLTSKTRKDHTGAEDDYKMKYERHGGVWVLAEMTYVNTSNRRGARVRLTKRVTFADHVVNDPVAAGEFSLKKLGLKRGDVVSDERTSVQSDYEPGDFEDGGNGGEAAQGADGQRPPGRQN